LAAQAVDPDNAAAIIDAPGTVSGLVVLLLGGAACVVEQAAAAVEALALYADDSHIAIMVDEPGLLQALMDIMCSSSSSSSSMGSTPAAQQRAAQATACLAQVPAARKVLGKQQGLVETLVALLSSSNSDGGGVQAAAAWALRWLAEDWALAETILFTPGATGGLAALLKGGLGPAKDTAVAAIYALVEDRGFKRVEPQAMTPLAVPLVQVLKDSSSSPEARGDAAGAIGCLASANASVAVLGKQPGLVKSLVAMLRSSSSSSSSSSSNSAYVQQQAALALRDLAAHEVLALRIVKAQGAMTGLMALLRGSTGGVQVAAAAAMATLMQHSSCRPESPQRMAALAAALVQVLVGGDDGDDGSSSSSTLDARALAGRTISHLAGEPAAWRVFEKHQTSLVGALVGLLSSSNRNAQVAAGHALNRLARNDDMAQLIMQDPGIVAGLVALWHVAPRLQPSNFWYKLQAFCTPVFMARVAEMAPRLVEAMRGGGSITIASNSSSGCSSGVPVSQVDAADAVAKLAQQADVCRLLMQQAGLVGGLVALLQDECSAAERACCDVAQATACFVQHAVDVSTPPLVELTRGLMQAVGSKHWRVQEYAARAIYHLAHKAANAAALLAQEPGLVGCLVILLSSSTTSSAAQSVAAATLCNLAGNHAVAASHKVSDSLAAAAITQLASTAASTHSSSSSSSMALLQGLVAGFVRVMGSGISSSRPVLQACATAVIATLCTTPSIRQVLVQQQGLVTVLLASLSDSCEDVQSAAGQALQSLASEPACVQAIVGLPDVLSSLVSLLTSPLALAASQATLVLRAMVQCAPNRCAGIGTFPGLLPGLRHVMRSERSTYAAVVFASDAVKALEAGQPLVSASQRRGGVVNRLHRRCITQAANSMTCHNATSFCVQVPGHVVLHCRGMHTPSYRWQVCPP
jgi:hypothetical protein